MGAGLIQGYAIVQFETEEAAERALRLSGQVMMGRELFVDTARRKKDAEQAESHADCWFCLSNPNADVSLVASIGA